MVTKLAIALAIASASLTLASNAILPGTPCVEIIDVNRPCDASSTDSLRFAALDPIIPLADPSVTHLGMFVVPGDVIIFEGPGGSVGDPTTWSDLLHFATGANASVATVFPDGENGVIGLPPGFTLSGNFVAIQESPTEPFTIYIAGANEYHIFSDCAGPGCEIPEPNETPEPGTMGVLGLALSGVLVLNRLVRRRSRTD